MDARLKPAATMWLGDAHLLLADAYQSTRIAEQKLLLALRTGRVDFTCAHVEGHYPGRDIRHFFRRRGLTAVEADVDYEATAGATISMDWEASSATQTGPKFLDRCTLYGIRISREHVLKLLPPGYEPASLPPQKEVPPADLPLPPMRAGRKAEIDWEEVFGVVLLVLYRDGWPDDGDISDFSRRVVKACTETAMKSHIPSFEAVRAKLPRWFKLKRREELNSVKLKKVPPYR